MGALCNLRESFWKQGNEDDRVKGVRCRIFDVCVVHIYVDAVGGRMHLWFDRVE